MNIAKSLRDREVSGLKTGQNSTLKVLVSNLTTEDDTYHLTTMKRVMLGMNDEFFNLSVCQLLEEMTQGCMYGFPSVTHFFMSALELVNQDAMSPKTKKQIKYLEKLFASAYI